MKRFTYSDLLSDDDQQTLLQIAEGLSGLSWAIGDLALGAFHNRPEGVDSSDISKAVGSLVGMRSKAVLQLMRTSSAFGPENREHPVLQHGHFQAAAGLKNAEEALTWAESQVDELNRPATVDALTVVFPHKETVQAITDTQDPRAVEIAKKTAKRRACRILSDLIAQAKIGKLDIDTKTFDALVSALDHLREVDGANPG